MSYVALVHEDLHPVAVLGSYSSEEEAIEAGARLQREINSDLLDCGMTFSEHRFEILDLRSDPAGFAFQYLNDRELASC